MYTILYNVIQTEMKGLPTFVLNQALKRHTWAIHYIRRQLVNPQEPASQLDSSEDEDSNFGHTESDSDRKESSFEEQVPTSHFIDEH